MKRNYILSLFIIGAFLLCEIVACIKEERISRSNNIVINELMASNRTGLLNEKQKPADWIEIKNTSKDTIELKGYQLAIKKWEKDSINPQDSVEKIKIWTFPDVKIAGGEYKLIFADKEKESKDVRSLSANFKLPRDGGILQILNPVGDIITELKYNEIPHDNSLSLQRDSTYIITSFPSPGFENSLEGYETVIGEMEKQRQSPLLIWEVMSREKNSWDNWVELKNISNVEVELSEYTLSKKLAKGEGWQLPARILKPGELITIQLAGRKANKKNPLQAPFKLGNSETVVLSKDGKFIDGVNAKSSIYGGSIGRIKGKDGFFYFTKPTKNLENSGEGRRYISEKPEFTVKPGVYPKDSALTIKLKDHRKRVHYTLDGSEPTIKSPIFKDSLIIRKNTVVRAYAEGDSINLRSGVSTSSYLLGIEHTLPVVSVSMDHNDLYNYNSGIYVDGPGYSEQWPHLGSNYWKKWIKKGHVELFEENGRLAQDCGVKIFGGFSRAEPKKSFTLKFKSEYGESDVSYDFFGDGERVEMQDLVLRSGSQDYNRCMIRDEFFTSLMAEHCPTLLVQKYRPVTLYINGSYFGLFYIREKIDRHFVSRKLEVPNDSINIIFSVGTAEEGSSGPYKNLMQYITSHDMKDPNNYEYIKKNVDLQGLIDYKIGEIYSGNSDVGNIRYVRSTSSDSDKKWRFVFYDLDATWVENKPASFYLNAGTGGNETYVTKQNIMINRLLRNKEFRDLFLQRLSYHLTNTFSVENTTRVYENIVAQILPEMERNCERWPQLSYKQWEKNIESFKKKFETKPKFMLNDIRKYLSVTPEENKKYFSHLGY